MKRLENPPPVKPMTTSVPNSGPSARLSAPTEVTQGQPKEDT